MKYKYLIAINNSMLLVSILFAADWPYWRGPYCNSMVEGEIDLTIVSRSISKEIWKKEIGIGYSSITVSNGKLYTSGILNGKGILWCLDTSSGKELWKYEVAISSGKRGEGMDSTPIVDDKRVYFISGTGKLICFNSDNGNKLWEIDMESLVNTKRPTWMHAASPVIVNNLVVLNMCSSGVAVNKVTGHIVWNSAPGVPGYATPVIYKKDGDYFCIIFGFDHLYYIEVKTGKVLWSIPWQTKWNVNAADPVVLDDSKIFISSGYGRGCGLVEFKSGEARLVWESKLLSSHFASFIYNGNVIYGIDGDARENPSLVCLDINKREILWKANLNAGSLIKVGQKLLILNQEGTIIVAGASPKEYKELGRVQTSLKKKCWTIPAWANNKLFCRDNDQGLLVCIDF